MNKLSKTLFVLWVILLLNACQMHKSKQSKAQSWMLNPEYSNISIVTTKNNSISEVSSFNKFSGNIDANGQFNLSIDLASLETNIPVRNERIQKHLFQTDLYPTADIHTQLKPEDLNNGVHKLSFDVDLHGISGIISAEFMVFEQNGNKVVTLHKPLVIRAADFGLENGITTLRNIAKLNSIDFTVPIHVVLSFAAK